MWYPIDTETAQLNSAGLWEVDFGPYQAPRVLEWISLVGPASSTVNLYVDSIFLDTTARGDFNRADYPNGIPIAGGRQIRLVWSIGTGLTPVASIGMTDGNPRVMVSQSPWQ